MKGMVAVLVAMAVVGLCAVAVADEVKAKKSRLLEISGSLSLDWLWQDDDVNRLLYPPAPGKRSEASAYCDPTLTLDMLFMLKEGLRAFVQLRTPYYLDDSIGSRPYEVMVGDETAYYPARVFQISQLYLKAEEFRWQWLDLCIGVQNLRYEMSHHGAFLIALDESEDPFAGKIYANWPMDRVTPTKEEIYSNRFSFNDRNAGSVEAGGLLFKVRPKMPKGTIEAEIDLFALTTFETMQLGQDRDIIGAVGRIFYPKKSDPQVDVMLALVTFGVNSNSRIITLGGGFNWKATHGLEVYGEAYGQTGEFYEGFDRSRLDDDDYWWLSSRSGTIQQQAFAGYAGVRYTYIPSGKKKGYIGWRPFFDISYWWISGDKNPHDLRNQDFIAYEDVDSTLIMEENRYGLDLDTNYWALKVMAGYSPKNVEFSVLYALFERARDYTAKDKIGNELDIILKWHYSVALTFRFGVGVVWDSPYLFDDDKSSLSAGLFEVVLKF